MPSFGEFESQKDHLATHGGYPCYRVFLNDSALDRIRKHADFATFMTEQRARFEASRKLAR